MPLLRTLCSLSLAMLVAAPVVAQERGGFDLTVASIMRGPELVGSPPSAVRWTDDGRWVFFRWKPGGRPWHEEAALYRVRSSGGEPERLSREAADSLEALVARGPISPDRRLRAVVQDGDLFLIDRARGTLRRLTRTRDAESSPAWNRDGSALYFVRANNVYSIDLASGATQQLTDVRTGSPPEERKPAEGQRGVLERAQEELFEAIRIEKARRERADSLRKAREAAQIKPLFLASEERLFGISVDPDARYAVIEVGRQARNERRTIVPDFVTISGYTEPREVRGNVGDVQGEGRMGLVSLTTGAVEWLKLASAAADSAAKKEGHSPLAAANFVGWNDAGTTGLIVATGYDYKDRWFYAIDGGSGRLTLLAHDHDDAWLQGPCDRWDAEGGCVGWMPDGRSVYFVSERDGFAHVYVVNADGSRLRQLTSGRWEVLDARLSPDRQRFYLETSETSPYESHFYHMPLSGGARTRITTQPGLHNVTASPDGRLIADVYSQADVPPELYIGTNRAGTELRRVTTSPTAEWRSGPWIRPEIVEFTARDGVKVPARIYRPRDFGVQPNGAGVIFVHGAGYLQNVHRGWSTYFREYMFHHLLASRGYTVLDVDYRGSKGYGRDWRTAVYRHMGGKDLDDITDGAKYLAQHEGVDAERIGLYGGSYGGFITLMALFTEADVFAAGAALRSVTDWAHYNHWYTSRILNLPQSDSLAYRQSSPIYFAEGLEDPLLIAHGMVDVNVHFSDVVRLAQRLIELGKTDWEMAVYPVEDHAFTAPSSWTDEYRRILELFEEHLRQ